MGEIAFRDVQLRHRLVAQPGDLEIVRPPDCDCGVPPDARSHWWFCATLDDQGSGDG